MFIAGYFPGALCPYLRGRVLPPSLLPRAGRPPGGPPAGPGGLRQPCRRKAAFPAVGRTRHKLGSCQHHHPEAQANIRRMAGIGAEWAG
jgi:hypothetical protein